MPPVIAVPIEIGILIRMAQTILLQTLLCLIPNHGRAAIPQNPLQKLRTTLPIEPFRLSLWEAMLQVLMQI